MLGVLLTAATHLFAPVARAEMVLGNYDFNTDWDPAHHWVWSLRPCAAGGPVSCIHLGASPRPMRGAAPYGGEVQTDGNHYTLVADLPTGLVCFGGSLPTHNTYSWDSATLAGTVISAFEQGCGGGAGGTFTYAFSLARL